MLLNLLKRLGRGALPVLLSLSLASCYTVRTADMFPIQREPLGAESLASLSVGGIEVEHLHFSGSAEDDIYRIRVPDAHGTIVFFGGNGNQLEPVIVAVTPHIRKLGLDLVFFNYWPSGQPRPDVASTNRAADRLVDKAIEISPGPVCVVGHSLGAWFALNMAGRRDVSGAAVAGVGTTPKDLTVAQAGALRPFLWRSAQESSLDSLDGIRLAAKVATPILIATSTGDTDIPVRLSTQVFDALPTRLEKHLLTLNGVPHGGYLISEQFWDTASQYLCR